MNVDYGYRKEIKLSFNISLMKGEDKIRLTKDLIVDLLLTDGLREEYRSELRAFMFTALEESA